MLSNKQWLSAKTTAKTTALGLLAAMFSLQLSAHTMTVVPSHYVQSKTGGWVSVDVSATNMTFQWDKGIPLENFKVFTPDGQQGKVDSVYQGKRKSQADVELATEGTYRLELGNGSRFFTSYELKGERKRLMANKKDRAAQLPAGAEKVVTTQGNSRALAFITVNKPSDAVLALTNKGLEFQFDRHPADIVATEEVTVTLLMNGKPAAGVELDLSRDGELYRNEPERMHHKTDASGKFSFTAPVAGRYLLEASYQADVSNELTDKVREGFTLSFEAALP
ncbi:DUF4198 domain-containing protein [Rheinheimera sp. SA_1]|uniref:DUF4198 domain-containing protein n=1 Tax=Rheinheimera sp. SA_1 TaxID=1827365 RepID=UPI0009EE8C45|nr:DUF4198 domain-containing protein [Rheinheimera sp. SA_1]